MKKLLKFTFVTAVLNEEKKLPVLAKHLSPFIEKGAQWLVVVDSRTTDKSAQIAGSLGARVLREKKGQSEGIVFHNKNWGIDEAEYDWIFIIDADESMDKTLQKEIVDKVLEDREPYVWETGFINIEFGKKFELSEIKNKTFVRLFKRGNFWYDTTYTALGSTIEKWRGEKGILKGRLIHDIHPTITSFIKKINLYSDREARIILRNKPNISTITILVNMIYKSKQEFFKKYFLWKIYKEGMHGFIVAVILGFYHLLIWAKVYELKYSKDKLFF